MPAVSISALTKSYGKKRVLHRVDLRIEEGERVALLGPNGAGKTTTLMSILGLVAPDSGDIHLHGLPMPERRQDALRATSFTASYLGLPGALLVREFLALHADVHGVPYTRVTDVCAQLGIAHLLGNRGNHLSSGQRTLVCIAKCLVPAPRLVVLDEPTASLDPLTAFRIRHVLRGVPGTLLLTSHNMLDVEALCDRVVFMHRGRVVADAAPAQLAQMRGVAGLDEAFRAITEDDEESL